MKGPTTLRNRYASVRCRAKRMEARLPPVIFLQKQVFRRILDDLTLLLRSFASLRGGLAARRVCYIIFRKTARNRNNGILRHQAEDGKPQSWAEILRDGNSGSYHNLSALGPTAPLQCRRHRS